MNTALVWPHGHNIAKLVWKVLLRHPTAENDDDIQSPRKKQC